MKKLLVIDDEHDFCILVLLECKKIGIECKYANTLVDGIELLNSFSPDILILDNNLPDGLGWQQVDYLLKHYPSTKLNLITAKNIFEKTVNDYANKGKNVSCYSKPLTITDLSNILNERSQNNC